MIKLLLLTMLLILSGASASEEFNDSDPWENLNRKFYALNFEILDPLAVKPLASVYDGLTPNPIRKGVSNFFANLNELPNSVNSLLQGKVGQSVNDAGRFLINSTLGIGGLFDVASSSGLQLSQEEDFGQTLAVWGVGQGPYLMLPFLGPSTLRDAPSSFFDSFLDPFSYNNNYGIRIGIKAIDIVAIRADLLGLDDMMSGDKYLFVRDVYLQNRAYVISDGAIEDDFDDLEDY